MIPTLMLIDSTYFILIILYMFEKLINWNPISFIEIIIVEFAYIFILFLFRKRIEKELIGQTTIENVYKDL